MHTRDRVSTERVSTYPPLSFLVCQLFGDYPAKHVNHQLQRLLHCASSRNPEYPHSGSPTPVSTVPPSSRVSTPTFNNQSRLRRRGANNSSRPAGVSFWQSFVFKQTLMCSRWGKTWHWCHQVMCIEWHCQEWAWISEVEKKGKILLTIMYITILWGLLTSWPRCTSQTSARRTSRLPSRYLQRGFMMIDIVMAWPKTCRLTSQLHVNLIMFHLERMVAKSYILAVLVGSLISPE